MRKRGHILRQPTCEMQCTIKGVELNWSYYSRVISIEIDAIKYKNNKKKKQTWKWNQFPNGGYLKLVLREMFVVWVKTVRKSLKRSKPS